jgi:hypothetical protein
MYVYLFNLNKRINEYLNIIYNIDDNYVYNNTLLFN